MGKLGLGVTILFSHAFKKAHLLGKEAQPAK